ncbi:MAG: SDR family NAD(P)-dependent oxidoreductase [Solirubrobacteraceae bacterium]|nr:SDR family NAD(P)-dependent oxidoreductase [Solirubrobacteraceae bacterium]
MPASENERNTTIVVTGASSGIGAMTVRRLADAGHTVYAGMRDPQGRNASAAAEASAYASDHGVALHPLAMDVTDQASVEGAVAEIVEQAGGIDVVVHNAGHMVLGPAEAFSPEQLVDVYETNVVSTQRVNRAALPHLRAQGSGLLVWVGSSSTRGGTPPYLAPYFAAKAAEDALAVSYAAEVSRFGIDSVIIVPGSFTTGTNHFANAGTPVDADVTAAYDAVLPNLMDDVGRSLAALSPADADPAQVAVEIARVVELPVGERPFRVHIDPAGDGAEEVNRLGDAVRRRFYERIGLDDLLGPVRSGVPDQASSDDRATPPTRPATPADHGVRLLNPDGLTRVPLYHHVALASGTRQVHIAGQVSWNEDGTLVAPGDLAGQVEQVVRNVATALDAAGATFHDVVRMTWYAAGWKREMYDAFNEGLRRAAQTYDLASPPLALIGVDVLFEPGILVEAEVTAVIA